MAQPGTPELARGLERVGEFQATYRPKSKTQSVGTLVPANMQLAMDRALAKVQEEGGGSIDSFVAGKLGYQQAELGRYFSAEQVDAIALSIANLERGDGFIIGDQTGVGKGRVVAAIVRYAKRAGKLPVFVTAKPGLYVDMLGRDLPKIGEPDLRAFVTNSNLRGQQKLPMPTPGEYIESLPPLAHGQAMKEILEAAREKKAPANWDAVFTTYDQNSPVEGGFAERSRWLRALMPNAILILDESHKAGGSASQQFVKGAGGDMVPKASRAEFFRELVELASGVLYSSATYAKNPHVMTLYSRTDLAKGLQSVAKLPGLMKKGGVPLQQAAAGMLVDAGQYARREKSWDGIAMEYDTTQANRDVSERATGLLGHLFEFDLEMAHVREEYIKSTGLGGGGVGVGESSVGRGGAKSTSFASVMHNVISQMLLSLKAREAGRLAADIFHGRAVDAQGKPIPKHKPIIALANTMEGLLTDTVTDTDMKPGEEIPEYTFGKVFERYLERTRRITVKRPFTKGPGEQVYIPDEAMGHMLQEFEALRDEIAATDLGDMPASPIDAMIFEMEKGGMRVGEITGRQARVIYDKSGAAVLDERENSQAAKKKAMMDYNNGALDALVINESGAEGFSLHASPDNGSDVTPRQMFVVQAHGNIDTFMQLLGRINRTGQTALPRYSVLVSDLPSEKRPAAVLMKKMASLNANTSASRRSAVSLKNVVDFINEYGDKAVRDVLMAEPEIMEQLGLEDGDLETQDQEDGALARRVTGLLPRFAIPEQERILALIEDTFTARLEEANAKGENALEAQVLDLKAKTLTTTELKAGKPGSPFTAPVSASQVEITRKTKPPSFADLEARAAKLPSDVDAITASIDKALEGQIIALRERYQALEKKIAEHPETEAAARAQQETIKARGAKLSGTAASIKDRVRLLQNRSVSILDNDEERLAYLVGIEQPKRSVLAPSEWSLVMVPVDGDGTVRIPFSRLMNATIGEDDYVAVEPSRSQVGPSDFKGELKERKEQRWILGGNLLSGFEAVDGKGQIIFYTDDKGDTHQGILLRKGLNPGGIIKGKPVKLSLKQALKFLAQRDRTVESEDGVLTVIGLGEGRYYIAAQTRGGKPYYLSKAARDALGQDFESRRGEKTYHVAVDEERARKALKVYERDLGTEFFAIKDKEAAREITGEKVPETEGPEETDHREMMAFPGSMMPDVKAALDWMAQKLGYVRQQQATVGGTIPTEGTVERQIRRFQDTFRGVKTTQAEVKEQGGQLRDALDTYLAEELRRGLTRHRIESFDKGHIDPMLNGLRKDGISPEEAGEVLMARAAPDRNRITIGRDKVVAGTTRELEAMAEAAKAGVKPSGRKMARLIAERSARIQELSSQGFGSGFTDEEARDIVRAALDGKRAAGFTRLFERFDAMVEEIRQGWVRDGLKTQEEVDELKAEQPVYAPMRSDLDDDDAAKIKFKGTGRGVDVRGQEFKAALGRTTKADASNVLAYAFTQGTTSIVRGEKNRVARTFLRFLRANKELLEDFATIKPSQSKKALVNGVARYVFDPTFRLADNVIVVHERGQQVWIEIDPAYQNVADALKNLHAEDAGKAVRLIGNFTRYLAGVNTRYNPAFPLFNALRDAAGAFVNSQEHGIAYATRVVRDVPRAMYALSKAKLGKEGGSKWDAYAKEYVESGAPISFLDVRSYEEQLKLIEKRSRAASKEGAIGQMWRGWRDVLAVIDGANDIVENSTRFSAYVHAREDLKMPKARAASWSKNLTVNFERKGDLGSTIGALWLFANAQIQSTARVAQAVAHPAVRRLLIGAFLGSMLWDQLQRMIGGKDDDGEDRWDKVPNYVRRHQFVFMYPNSDRYVALPTPFVYDWIQTAGQMVSGYMSGNVSASKALLEATSAAFESFDPIGSGQLDPSDPASIARTIAPTVLDPIVELATNRDWKGDTILPDWYKTDSPDSQRFKDASGISVAVAQWVNKATGGDKFKPGAIDVSPETLDHWGTFLTGGAGRSFSQMFERGQRPKPGDIPVISPLAAPFERRIFRELSPFASVEDFRTLQKAIRIERDRAKDEGKLMSREIGSIWKEGNLIEDSRARRQKAIDAMEEGSEAQRTAQRQLSTDLQHWNSRARKALLSTK